MRKVVSGAPRGEEWGVEEDIEGGEGTRPTTECIFPLFLSIVLHFSLFNLSLADLGGRGEGNLLRTVMSVLGQGSVISHLCCFGSGIQIQDNTHRVAIPLHNAQPPTLAPS